jgi:hypothetical protein
VGTPLARPEAIKQPQHIELAAHLGLGIYDFNSPREKKNSIQHQVVNLARLWRTGLDLTTEWTFSLKSISG